MLSESIQWIADRYLEIVATISGLLYIFLSIRQNILAWPFGIVSSALYVYVTYISRIYADMGIYIYYVIIGFYGWYNWLYGGTKDNKNASLQIQKVKLKRAGILFLITCILFIVIVYILKNHTTSDVPYLDAFTTALSITATWMLTQKILEQWIVWIIVDAVTVGLYFYKGLYPSIVLYLVYTIMAIVGYIDWKKEWEKQQKTA